MRCLCCYFVVGIAFVLTVAYLISSHLAFILYCLIFLVVSYLQLALNLGSCNLGSISNRPKMSGVVKEEPKVKAEAFFLEVIKVMTPHDMVDGII